mmetsp:Transcript_10258/g.14498  ORF Transcript_10258/g.14498 Transcript_10258/m.14498 type:complete len:98 (+) Transcript_10258:3456-3749(+)
MGSSSYIKEALKVADTQMKKHGLAPSSTWRQYCHTPFNLHEHCPELEDSPFCNDELCNVYQNLIGVLRWTCELGRIDILHKVLLLSQYLAQPRIGHL